MHIPIAKRHNKTIIAISTKSDNGNTIETIAAIIWINAIIIILVSKDLKNPDFFL